VITLIVIGGYLLLLLGLGFVASRFGRGTSGDYMLASHTIGPFMLLMSLFGTTMTAFALIGSTAEAFKEGIGVYGLMASSSGVVHSACFFLFGVKVYQWGKRFGYRTQVALLRDRLQCDWIGLVLFPLLVALVVPYVLIGVLGGGLMLEGVTARGPFPVPQWLGSLIICGVVLTYVFFGGMRGAAWANTFQTLVFMALGVVTFFVIAERLGGPAKATEAVAARYPSKLQREADPADTQRFESHATDGVRRPPTGMGKLYFFSYLFIPLSVATFPHVYQHWLTARDVGAFKLSVVGQPLCIMIVWIPCVLIGVWATAATINGESVVPPDLLPKDVNKVLPLMVARLAGPWLAGLLSAGVLAAIMSSLDSQFLCLGTMFTEDIVHHYGAGKRMTERQVVLLARSFIVLVVAVCFGLSLLPVGRVFTLAIWCFSGFAALAPVLAAVLYWKRLTAWGAAAGMLATAATGGWFFAQAEYGLNPHFTVFGMLPVVAMTAASTVATVLVSLVTRPPGAATLARFFPR